MLGRFEAKIEMDGPIPLTQDQFKERLKKLAGTTLIQGITRRKLKEFVEQSNSFEEAIFVMCGPEAFDKSDTPWQPVPGTPLYEYAQSEFSIYKQDQLSEPSRSNWPLTLVALVAFAVIFGMIVLMK